MAGFGHLINDWFDIEADRRAGKRNVLAPLGPLRRSILVFGFLALAALPWLFLPRNRVNLVALAAEALLLTIYAAPPLRLKERPEGVLADALYGYTVPFVITWATFGKPLAAPDLLVLLAWVTLVGLRSILNHQLLDLDNDALSGVRTLAWRIGRPATTTLLTRLVLPLEAMAFVPVTALFVAAAPWYGVLAVLFVAWRAFQVAFIWKPGREGRPCLEAYGAVHFYGYILLNEYYEKAMPVLFLAGLVVERPELAWLLLGHVAVFRTNALSQVARDRKGFRTGWNEFLAAHRRTPAAPGETR
jgi:4-hydroxybenzoate polyprenyltransferase